MKNTLLVVTVLAAFGGLAVAQTPAQNPAINPGSTKTAPRQTFSSLDTNKDGRVSRDEVKSHAELTTSFGKLDSDSNTYLSESEFGKWHSFSAPGATSPGNSNSPPNDGASQPAKPGQNSGSRSGPANGSPQSSPGAK